MEIIKNQTAIFSKVLRIVYLGLLLFHLLLWSLNVKGQTSLRPGFPRCACPPLARVGGGSAPSSTQDLIRKIYTSQIGVREKQPNSGPEVEKYLRYVNLPKGNPWCAAFVCWTLGEAGVENPRSGWSPSLFGEPHIVWSLKAQGTKSKPAWPVGREQRLGQEPRIKNQESRFGGESQDGYRYNRVDGISLPIRFASPARLITDYRLPITGSTPMQALIAKQPTPNIGDVFGLYFPEKGRIAHVGFVDDWQDPWVTTVEGNTNVIGSREGDGVYRKRRLIASIFKVARYIN